MRRYLIPAVVPLLFAIGWPAHFLATLEITGAQAWQIYAFYLIFTLLPACAGFWYGYDIAKDRP